MAVRNSKSSDREVESAAAQWIAKRDAGLSSSDASALRQWLAEDPRHQRAFDQCANAWSVLAA
ncbi:MAG TPA: DUF4880 domain-containing protein, partial [Opitutaceae bacterium]|nr:DUF4880 domain-containing protein [Opitutaceae bacterium]